MPDGKGKSLEAMAQFEHALASYDQAISLKHDYDEAHIRRSSVLLKLNRTEEANCSCNRASWRRNHQSRATRRSWEYPTQLNRIDEAIAVFDRAIAANPEYPEAYYENRARFLRAGAVPSSSHQL